MCFAWKKFMSHCCFEMDCGWLDPPHSYVLLVGGTYHLGKWQEKDRSTTWKHMHKTCVLGPYYLNVDRSRSTRVCVCLYHMCVVDRGFAIPFFQPPTKRTISLLRARWSLYASKARALRLSGFEWKWTCVWRCQDMRTSLITRECIFTPKRFRRTERGQTNFLTTQNTQSEMKKKYVIIYKYFIVKHSQKGFWLFWIRIDSMETVTLHCCLPISHRCFFSEILSRDPLARLDVALIRNHVWTASFKYALRQISRFNLPKNEVSTVRIAVDI